MLAVMRESRYGMWAVKHSDNTNKPKAFNGLYSTERDAAKALAFFLANQEKKKRKAKVVTDTHEKNKAKPLGRTLKENANGKKSSAPRE